MIGWKYSKALLLNNGIYLLKSLLFLFKSGKIFMLFNEVHLCKLVRITNENGHSFNYGGGNPQSDLLEPIIKAANVLSGGQTHFDFGFENRPLTKENVKSICDDSNSSNLKCYIAICAWGGMNLGNFVNSLGKWQEICEIIGSLRKGELSPFEAYNDFSQAKISGLGPAFFTKIIYFLTSNGKEIEQKGFIMDQYTAKSMNLLKQVVEGWSPLKLTNDMLARSNTKEHYQSYCRAIIELSKKLYCDPEIAEEIIFSGKEKVWRKYANKQHKELQIDKATKSKNLMNK